MPRTRQLVAVPVIAIALALVTIGQPAEAAAKRPAVTLKASPSTVAVNSSTALTGKVSGKSPGTTVRLQKRTGGAWKSVKSTKVKANKSYRFKITIRDAKNRFRVRVVKNKRLKAAASKTVTVIGSTADNPVRTLILRKTNEFRASNGLPPLALMSGLDAVAQGWSEHMAATSDFSHNPRFSQSYPAGWTRAGENIAAGQTPEAVVAAWIESPGHRANLLGDYNYIGIGYATGGSYRRYYTQNFAKY